jgi:tetratricopeptide (TPR) repeat protein
MDRIDALKGFIESRPDDPFPRYGLALEYANRGQLAEAVEAFQLLVARMPDYVPTYLMYGNTLAKLGERERASEIYREGIGASARAGDAHAKAELEAALAEVTEDE